MSITAEEIVRHIDGAPGHTTRQLRDILEVDEKAYPQFVDTLMDLQVAGEILRVPNSGWDLPNRTTYRVGTLQIDRRGGSGFVRVSSDDESPEGDVFVREENLLHAFPGDFVLVRIERRARGDRLREGNIVDVVRRSQRLVRGTYWSAKKGGFVSPAPGTRSLDVHVSEKDRGGASDRDRVVVRLLNGAPLGVHPRGRDCRLRKGRRFL